MILSKKILPFLVLIFSTLVLFSSCEDDEDPVIPNEEEVITTLTYTLTADGQPTVVLSFKDLDGDGGNSPVITGGTLAANTVYEGKIELLNEIEGEDITEEIEEEDDEHQFFFSATGLDLAVAYNDTDGTNPVGLQTTVSTGEATTGTLKVTLRHEPSKDAEGVSDGVITNAGGETDIEVEFDVTVE
ncbi:hypothetical protein [Bernardetia litoralis]|nr:hypothetical protein [Bernardetia litoralis]